MQRRNDIVLEVLDYVGLQIIVHVRIDDDRIDCKMPLAQCAHETLLYQVFRVVPRTWQHDHGDVLRTTHGRHVNDHTHRAHQVRSPAFSPRRLSTAENTSDSMAPIPTVVPIACSTGTDEKASRPKPIMVD